MSRNREGFGILITGICIDRGTSRQECEKTVALITWRQQAVRE